MGQGGENMDIQNINTINQSAKTSRQNSTQAQVKEFQDYLDAFSEKTIADDTSPVKPAGNIQNVQPIPFVNMTSPQKEIVEKVGSVLGLFETYAMNLRNPDKTLKDIEPALLRMKHAADRLNKETLLHEDRGSLSQLVNNLQVTASVEYFKFQRGDYI
jgi:hypothetical protein